MALAVYIARIFMRLFEGAYLCSEHVHTSDQKRRNGKTNEVPSTQLVDVIPLVWQWYKIKVFFLIWRFFLLYLDAIDKR
jgi:hypothetical protein